MSYRRSYRKPERRTITVKYSGPCACCGATINAGETADYFPVGTIASQTTPAIAHPGGLDGNSAKCAGIIRHEQQVDAFDMRVEDSMAEACGFSPFGNND